MHSDLEKRLRRSLRELGLGSDIRLVVAVSGGADSVALLDALVRMRKGAADLAPVELIVAHFNHLLRGDESDEDERFVESLARRYELPFAVAREDIAGEARLQGRNLEAVARERRYRFLARTARKSGAPFVATAHTRDDQVETVLLRLLRGAGTEGLGGMRRRRRLDEGVDLIRPLLSARREDVLAHCARYGLDYRTDSSNLSPAFARNRIRLVIAPELRLINPRFDEAIARAAELISEDEEYLGRLAASVLAEAQSGAPPDGGLDVSRLSAEPAALRRRALREWLRRARGDLRRIERAHLDAIDALVTRGQSGRRVELPGGSIVVREFDRLELIGELEEPNLAPQPVREGTETRFGAYRLMIRRRLRRDEAEAMLESADEGAILGESEELDSLFVRARSEGDAYVPAESEKAVKVKKLMIRARIPLRARRYHPLLVTAGGEILWGPGLPVARRAMPGHGSGQGAGEGHEQENDCALITAHRLDSMQPKGGHERL